MICFECGEQIVSKNPDNIDDFDYFIIQRKSTGVCALYFCVNCFESAAGTLYGDALNFRFSKEMCLLCGLHPRVNKLKTCQSCSEFAPKCPSCGLRMILRINKDKRGKFYGCPAYPRCTRTLNF